MKHVVAFLSPFFTALGACCMVPDLPLVNCLIVAGSAGFGGLMGKEGNAWAKRRKR